jgi:hypothetical protein
LPGRKLLKWSLPLLQGTLDAPVTNRRTNDFLIKEKHSNPELYLVWLQNTWPWENGNPRDLMSPY